MKTKYRAMVAIIIVSSLAILAIMLPIKLGSKDDETIASEIKANAFKTAKDIKSYHIQVEIRNADQGTLGSNRLDKGNIWMKGPDKFRVDIEITGLEDIGISTAKSTTIQNGRCVYTFNSKDICIYDNCPPFDYFYGEFDCPYIMADELNALAEANLIDVLGDEKVIGKDAYKVETRHDKETIEIRPDLPDREVRWVEKNTSICLKKETYKADKLVNTVEVINYEINNDIPDSIFVPEKKGKICRENCDGGYREIDLEKAPKTCGFVPLIPSYIPEGFVMSSTGWRDPEASGLPQDLPSGLAPMWYKPLYITFNNSVSEIYICEAKKYDKDTPDTDSLTVNPDGGLNVIKTDLSGGRTGYYVPEERTLYFFNGDIKIRIKASLTMEELVKIAESMSKSL